MLFTTNKDEAYKVLSKEVKLFKTFKHIDSNIKEETLIALDNLFIELKDKPNVYQACYTDTNGQRMSVFTIEYDGDTYIDYNAYLTWSNTFYLRYAKAFTAIHEHGKRFISPQSRFNLACYLSNNPEFKPLKIEQVT